MFGTTAVSSVRSADYYSIMANKIQESRQTSTNTEVAESQPLSGQGVTSTSNANVQGVMTKFRENVKNFSFGGADPISGFNKEEFCSTSVKQVGESGEKEATGALSGFQDNVRKFATATLRGGGTGRAGDAQTAHGKLMETLKEVNTGATTSMKNTLAEYAKSLMESREPPVKIAQPIKIFWKENPTIAGSTLPDHIDISL
jgi:hypothetical protein